MRGVCECERTTELPQNAETGAPRADASDGEKAGVKLASEAAAEAQMSFVKILRILSEIHNTFELHPTHTASWGMKSLARPLRGLASRFSGEFQAERTNGR